MISQEIQTSSAAGCAIGCRFVGEDPERVDEDEAVQLKFWANEVGGSVAKPS